MRNANQNNKLLKMNVAMATSNLFDSEESGGPKRDTTLTKLLPMNLGIRSEVNIKEVGVKSSYAEDLLRNYGCSS